MASRDLVPVRLRHGHAALGADTARQLVEVVPAADQRKRRCTGVPGRTGARADRAGELLLVHRREIERLRHAAARRRSSRELCDAGGLAVARGRLLSPPTRLPPSRSLRRRRRRRRAGARAVRRRCCRRPRPSACATCCPGDARERAGVRCGERVPLRVCRCSRGRRTRAGAEGTKKVLSDEHIGAALKELGPSARRAASCRWSARRRRQGEGARRRRRGERTRRRRRRRRTSRRRRRRRGAQAVEGGAQGGGESKRQREQAVKGVNEEPLAQQQALFSSARASLSGEVDRKLCAY